MATLAIAALGPTAYAQATSSSPSDARPTIAVMYFTNGALIQHNDYEPLTKGVAAVLGEELQSNDSIRVVEREFLQQVLEEQKLTETKRVDPGTAVQVGKLLGARYMIFGGFLVDMEGRMRITARAVNVETGETEHVESVEDKANNVLAMLSALAQKMNKGMRLPSAPNRAGSGAGSGASTGTLDDLRRYARAAGARDVAAVARDSASTQQAIALYKEFLAKAPQTMLVQRNEAEKKIAQLTRGT
ncbi:MAG: Curli production assembly/transport component CsgG [Geminicoccaceae bacterium]|jgi:TolB-like protein|nr:Curli production assembly/transport component CsgG [Geminicoccaceae bacterium]